MSMIEEDNEDAIDGDNFINNGNININMNNLLQ